MAAIERAAATTNPVFETVTGGHLPGFMIDDRPIARKLFFDGDYCHNAATGFWFYQPASTGTNFSMSNSDILWYALKLRLSVSFFGRFEE